ncbi:hypothetical protein ASG95_00640 [Phycicoccus sp. Soil803]|nr:hypothetical protein ASG95_00640 [Phycicoccus sp. Soil803]
MDGLRLVAALAVLVFHFTARSSDAWGQPTREVWPGVSRLSQYGELGVNLFFLISGFVILMSAWGRTVGDFAVSRVVRLFPAYWFGVLATGFLLMVIWPDKQVRAWQVLGNLTMVQSALGVSHVDGVYWTLWVELRFYLLMALFVAIGITRTRVIGFILVWPVLASYVHRFDGGLLAALLNWEFAPHFAVGMALCLLYREGSTLVNWLVLGYASACLLGRTAAEFSTDARATTGMHPSLTVNLVVQAVSILAVGLCATPAVSRLDWRWLSTAGSLTYPLYLLHEYWGWYVIHLVHPHFGKWTTLVAATACCLVAAAAVHRWVERPLAPRLKATLSANLATIRVRDRDDAARR